MPQEDAPANLWKLVNEVKRKNRGEVAAGDEKMPPVQAAS